MNISNDYFFNEMYGYYYATVIRLINNAVNGELTQDRALEVISSNDSFSDKFKKNMLHNFTEWSLVKNIAGGDGKLTYEISAECVTERPISLLEKRWLKSIVSDPRIILFGEDLGSGLEGVEPLFHQDDFRIVGSFNNGDDFSNPNYIKCFRTILKAIREDYALKITSSNSFGKVSRRPFTFIPDYIEYSEMEDKFSVYGCSTNRHYNRSIVNIGRIISCELCAKPQNINYSSYYEEDVRVLKVLLDGKSIRRMNALERMLIEFSSYKKKVTETVNKDYLIEVEYRKREEKEMLVLHLMQFAHCVKILAPESVRQEIKNRLLIQEKLFSDIL